MKALFRSYQWISENRKYPGIVGIILLLALPFLVGPYLTTMLVFILIYALIAMGLGLLVGWAGQFSLGQGAFFGIGAYTSGLLSTSLGINPWLALVCSAVLTGIIAYILGKPLLSVPGFKVGFVTLAFSWMLFLIPSNMTSLGGAEGFSGIPRFSIGGFSFVNDFSYYFLALIIVCCAFFLNRNLIRSRLGKQAKAMDTFSGGNPVAARSIGIDTAKIKTSMFTIAGVYAGIAGSLYAHYTTHLNPSPFNVWASILVLIMVIIGGVKSIWGGIIGAVFYFGLQRLLATVLGNNPPLGWQYLILGIVVTLVLLFFPTGIAGFFQKIDIWLKAGILAKTQRKL